MTTGDIIIIGLMVLYIFLESFLKKKGENLATKQDIQEITKLAESIKNDVAFESQREHDFIEQRTELIISILKYAEEIKKCGIHMDYYVTTEDPEEKIDSLIQRVEEITTAATYNQYLIIASEKNLKTEDIKPLTEIIHVISTYGAAICEYGANAMTFILRIKENIELYKNCNQQQYMDIVVFARKKLEEMRKKTDPRSMYQVELDKRIIEYFKHLYKLYKMNFNLILNYNQPTP